MDKEALVNALDAILPQTQCTQCGYPACRPYAQALADGTATVNLCPPGGDAGIARLAELLHLPVLPFDAVRAVSTRKPRSVALIDEASCIGCTLCIQACPVDAIVGAARAMHTVISTECNGCELCIAPCPVDCIQMQPLFPAAAYTPIEAQHWRARYTFRQRRLTRERTERATRLAARAQAAPVQEAVSDTDISSAAKRALIAAAMARASRTSPGERENE